MSGFQFRVKPNGSSYKETFKYNEEFKEDTRSKDYQHHLKRDFYTVYNEAYVWMKPHLRK